MSIFSSFCFCLGATPSGAQDLALTLCSGMAQGPSEVLGMEPGSPAGKALALPAALTLGPSSLCLCLNIFQ